MEVAFTIDSDRQLIVEHALTLATPDGHARMVKQRRRLIRKAYRVLKRFGKQPAIEVLGARKVGCGPALIDDFTNVVSAEQETKLKFPVCICTRKVSHESSLH